MTELPPSLLASWPGRFRFPDLGQLLAGDSVPSSADLAAAALDGIIGGLNETAALHRLIAQGRFRAARRVLDECPLWDGLTKAGFAKTIDRQVRIFQQQLSADFQESRRRADAAGVPWTPTFAALWEQCVDDVPAVQRQFADAGDALQIAIDKRRKELEGRVDSAPSELAAVCKALLLQSENLETVVHLLKHGVMDGHPPEAITAPPEPASFDATQMLQWHLNPALRAPQSFNAHWQLAKKSSAHELLVKFAGLERGREVEARGFARVLSEFLGGPPEEITVDALEHGYLAVIPQALAVPQLQPIVPSASLELYICNPDVVTPPWDLGLRGYGVVGWSLPREDQAGRTEGAVLTLTDLLRLVVLPADPLEVRRVGLVRLLARKWPAARIGAGSSAQLEHTLRQRSSWETLAWLADIAGLGGAVTAARLAYLSGEYDAEVLFALLERLMQHGPHPQTQLEVAKLVRWWKEPQLLRLLEAVLTAPIRDSPAALTVFWAALVTSRPGTTVTLDELVATCSLEGAAPESRLEAALRNGMAELAQHSSMVNDTGNDELGLVGSGAVVGLRWLADSRLRSQLERGLHESAPETANAGPGLTPWQAYRFAVLPDWKDLVVALRGSAAEREDAEKALVQPLDALLEQASTETGPADAMAVLDELYGALREERPTLVLRKEGPNSILVEAGRAELLVILFEVLANAAETLADRGQIKVTVQPDEPDALIIVQDSGSGIPDEIQQDYRVFRPGVGTRGADRGNGLYLARELARRERGEIEVKARRSRHPILRGASIQIILPLSPPVT